MEGGAQNFLVLVLIFGLVPMIVCPIVAGHKNRSVGGWVLGGFFLGLIGMIIICCLPEVEDTPPVVINAPAAAPKQENAPAAAPKQENTAVLSFLREQNQRNGTRLTNQYKKWQARFADLSDENVKAQAEIVMNAYRDCCATIKSVDEYFDSALQTK